MDRATMKSPNTYMTPTMISGTIIIAANKMIKAHTALSTQREPSQRSPRGHANA